MLPKRKKSHYPVPGRRESLWKKRGTTIQYLLYFAAGVLLWRRLRSGVVRGRVYPMPDPGESTAGYTGTGPVGIVA